MVNEIREVIGALQSEVEFEAAVAELGESGIDRSRISFLAQEAIAASCADAVGCDITQLPRVEIGLSDDRRGRGTGSDRRGGGACRLGRPSFRRERRRTRCPIWATP